MSCPLRCETSRPGKAIAQASAFAAAMLVIAAPPARAQAPSAMKAMVAIQDAVGTQATGLVPVYMPYVQREDGMWVAAPTRRRSLERSIEPLPGRAQPSTTRVRPRLFERSLSDGPTPQAASPADDAGPSVVLDRYGRWRYRRDAEPAARRPTPRGDGRRVQYPRDARDARAVPTGPRFADTPAAR